MSDGDHQASDLPRVGRHILTVAEVDPYARLGQRIVNIIALRGNDASFMDRGV